MRTPRLRSRHLLGGAARLLLSASALALAAAMPRPAAAETATFFDSIFEGRQAFDQRVTDAGGTVNMDLLSGLTSNVASWARSGYTITSGNAGNRSTSTSAFASIQGPGGSFASGDGIRMTAAAIDSPGSGLVFTFDSPVNAFALDLQGWATCCFPSALYIAFDGGTPILVGSAAERNDNPGEARYNESMTFVAAISDSDTFTTVAFYGAASGDAMWGGGVIRYALVPLGGLTDGPPADPPADPPVDPPAGLVIDGSRPVFTEGDPAVQSATVTFNGGTFRPNSATAVTQPVVIEAGNGTIDTSLGPVILLGDISGTGQLQVLGGGVLTLVGNASNSGGAQVQSGTLSIQGVFLGSVTVLPGGTLTGGGSIGGGTIDGVLSPGASPGTIVFTAPVTLGAGSTTRLEIDGPGTGTGAGSHDRVLVIGAGSTLTAGGTLQPVLRGITGAATNSFTPVLGQSFRVIQAEGGLLGSFGGLTQPAAGLPGGARLDVLYGANTLDLVTTPASYANLAPLGIDQRRNQAAAGGALDAIRPAAGPRMTGDAAATFGALYALPAAAIAPALEQLSGGVHADALAAALAHRRILGAGTAQRMAAIRAGDPALVMAQGALAPRVALDSARSVQMSAMPGGGQPADWEPGLGQADGGDGAEGAFTGWSAWGRALGGWGSTGGDGAAPGHSRQSGGALVGADRRFAPGLTGGIALGFLRGTVDGDGSTGEVRLDSYQASLYGLYARPTTASVKPFIDATLGTGLSRYDSRRTIAFGTLSRRANADSDGTDVTAEAGFGVTTRVEGMDLEPRAFLRWDRIARGGFTESGAGSLNLAVNRRDADALRAGIGLSAARTLRLGEGFQLRPEARIGYAREMQDGLGRGTHRLGGAAFSVESARTGRDALTAGIGATAYRGDRFAVVADYDLQRSSGGTDHVLTLGLRWVW
ncbi:autotransporter outer membrane beta-barrel domain-containing protein [Falsiroseomonas sp.]|uniref:autotransporter family protein n=1 Tax=Falsiroseomonas sp. TaxID=2870721 RepID=UPI00272C1046|nr:autotransporter outer membrane beta-barrel domain-containing protein [Falsiroseomonas sp.]